MFLDDLEKDFPAICTVSVIGKSVEGRDIKVSVKSLIYITVFYVSYTYIVNITKC